MDSFSYLLAFILLSFYQGTTVGKSDIFFFLIYLPLFSRHSLMAAQELKLALSSEKVSTFYMLDLQAQDTLND